MWDQFWRVAYNHLIKILNVCSIQLSESEEYDIWWILSMYSLLSVSLYPYPTYSLIILHILSLFNLFAPHNLHPILIQLQMFPYPFSLSLSLNLVHILYLILFQPIKFTLITVSIPFLLSLVPEWWFYNV